MSIKVQKDYRTPNRLDQKRKSPCNIIINVNLIYNVNLIGIPIRITPDFSMETLKARRPNRCTADSKRSWMPAKTTLYLAKFSVTTDGENKIFHDKVKFKQYLSISAFLQKVEGKLPTQGS